MAKYPYIKKLNEEASLVFFIFLCLFCYVFADDPFPHVALTCRKPGLFQIPSRIQESLMQSERCYQQSKISQCLRQERGGWMCEVRDLLSSSHLRVSFQDSGYIFHGKGVMWPWRFRLYLAFRRTNCKGMIPINLDRSTKGTYKKHNQLHSYILRGFFLLNFVGCVG